MPSKTKQQPTIIGLPWSFRDIWNDTLDEVTDRPVVPRDYIYASELGGAFCDRYLTMNAVPYTNPANVRSRRKFQAGRVWEWLMGVVLLSAGIIKKKEAKVDFKLPRLLSVHGRLDYTAGGEINWNDAKDKVNKFKEGLELFGIGAPPFFFKAIDKFIDKYKDKLLAEYILEFKAISSFMMEKVKKTGAMSHQVLQKYHYLKGGEDGIQLAKLIYVCKDDSILEEFNVTDNEETFNLYRDDIKKMTKFYNEGFDKRSPQKFMPPKEPLVLFDDGLYRFNKNFKVEYSKYLKMLYGYETPEDYRLAWQHKVASWNRVFKRCVKNDKMTPKNNEVIAEVKAVFRDWDKYVIKAKKEGAFQKPEENEEE